MIFPFSFSFPPSFYLHWKQARGKLKRERNLRVRSILNIDRTSYFLFELNANRVGSLPYRNHTLKNRVNNDKLEDVTFAKCDEWYVKQFEEFQRVKESFSYSSKNPFQQDIFVESEKKLAFAAFAVIFVASYHVEWMTRHESPRMVRHTLEQKPFCRCSIVRGRTMTVHVFIFRRLCVTTVSNQLASSKKGNITNWYEFQNNLISRFDRSIVSRAINISIVDKIVIFS